MCDALASTSFRHPSCMAGPDDKATAISRSPFSTCLIVCYIVQATSSPHMTCTRLHTPSHAVFNVQAHEQPTGTLCPSTRAPRVAPPMTTSSAVQLQPRIPDTLSTAHTVNPRTSRCSPDDEHHQAPSRGPRAARPVLPPLGPVEPRAPRARAGHLRALVRIAAGLPAGAEGRFSR